ncbi:hypothetical protein SAY87_032411 [Trapa incisa]|uniref:FHA domain-containing protein n=1 Tax=Trapa incisa TaxID=236973 RepID=A0AAN7GFE8_9MYRT|nr:hypothetical protein SAY87_032411 [Trapa incisa]
MTTEMDPPPPSQPEAEPGSIAGADNQKTTEEAGCSNSSARASPMPPPPPKTLDSSGVDSAVDSASAETAVPKRSTKQSAQDVLVPYTIPSWSGRPSHEFYLEVLKDGSILDQLNVHEKGAYMFGRVDLCDFVLEHPTISRFHAVLQFNKDGEAFLYDLGSTHGTSVNKIQVKKKLYVNLNVGDIIRFGQSSRLYIFQGPTNLMPPEADLKAIKEVKLQEKLRDREASLQRARDQAYLADGISWGMEEDAIEEDEDETDEVTWQNYKGQLTEKQEKTREKVVKRMQKIAHMKKEIDAIRAKDIAQGGLTQGQQTQIARNEQRISQLLEELENLEETLNESIRESMGARLGKSSHGKYKGATGDDDDDLVSDDDEFYDRTKKKQSTAKPGENNSIETADSLLDKKDAITREIEEKKEILANEKTEPSTTVETGAGDPLDAFMSGLSSQLVLDKTLQIEKEISTLQSELERITYLLKIADPSGEASRKRNLKGQEPKSDQLGPADIAKKNEVKRSGKHIEIVDVPREERTASEKPGDEKTADADSEEKPIAYTSVKPQWLGAVEDKVEEESKKEAEGLIVPESDQFIDYKDRKKILSSDDDFRGKPNLGTEDPISGLIIRKRKQNEDPEVTEDKIPEDSTTMQGAELAVEDAVALLLKHQRGYHGLDSEGNNDLSSSIQSGESKKKPKRVLGPEKPSFLDTSSDYESWVPPQGQSGDGRTSLNDRYGY